MGAAPKLVEGHSYARRDYNGAKKNACGMHMEVECTPQGEDSRAGPSSDEGHLLPTQHQGSPPALAGKSPMLPGAAGVSPDLEPGKSCRIRGSFL